MKGNSRRKLCGSLVLAAWIVFSAMTTAGALSAPEALVERARVTVERMTSDPNFSWLRNYLQYARGVLIVPQFLRGGFIIGGSGGSGVFLAREPQTGKWSEPVFYTMGGGSIGLQIGASAAEVILMVRTERGVEAFYTSTFKLGADASAAVGPVGMGMEGSTPHNLSADILSFAKTKGLFAGISLEGAVLKVRDDWNQEYYGRAVGPMDIIIRKLASNPRSASLQQSLEAAASGR